MSDKRVEITLTASCNLGMDEVWPDGEPESWDAAAVLAALKKDGYGRWDLDAYGMDVEVLVFDGRTGIESEASGEVRR